MNKKQETELERILEKSRRELEFKRDLKKRFFLVKRYFLLPAIFLMLLLSILLHLKIDVFGLLFKVLVYLF